MILAAYTYSSGLRAPAMIAVVKDMLIYVTVIAALIIIPHELGGYAKIFASIPPAKLLLGPPSAHNLGQQSGYATLALGSALALFLYPHAITGLLSSTNRHVIKRNAVVLPAYSVALGLIALLGYMAIASGVKSMPAYAAGFKAFWPDFAVPALFLHSFPSWFVGVAFASIAIGALVPAAIMSIACANLFTRNIYREYFMKECAPAHKSRVAKITSLVVKLGALIFIVAIPQTYAINLQLLGGIWIIQNSACGADRPLYACIKSLGASRGMGRRHDGRHRNGSLARLQGCDLSAAGLRLDSALLCRAECARAECLRQRRVELRSQRGGSGFPRGRNDCGRLSLNAFSRTGR